MSHNRLIVCLLCCLFLPCVSQAAELPPGTALAPDQSLRIGNGEEPQSLDPQFCIETACVPIVQQVFDSLLHADTQGRPVPGAASSWQVSADGKTYTFRLRPHMKWSDGSALTAQDFVFGFQRWADPKTASQDSGMIEDIVNAPEIAMGKTPPSDLGVQAVDATTLVIRLTHPNTSFPSIVTITHASPVHKALYRKYKGRLFSDPKLWVSNGPYLLTTWAPEDHIVIKKNPYYWNHNKVVITQATFYPVTDTHTEFQMYTTGKIDITSLPPPEQFKHQKPGGEFQADPILGSYNYQINMRTTTLGGNKKLRQALSMTIDRQALTQSVLGMGRVPAYDYVPRGTQNFTHFQYDWQSWPMAKRVTYAQQLYADAGYSADNPLHISLSYNTSQEHRTVAAVVSSMWAKTLGVKVSLNNEEWKTLLANAVSGNYEMVRMGTIANYNDAYYFLMQARSFDTFNTARYKNPDYDNLMAKAQGASRADERRRFMQQADALFMQDYVFIPLFFYTRPVLVKPYVKGFKYNPLQEFFLEDTYIVKH